MKSETINLHLWNAVNRTDPSNTNRVNARGGFTAICAQSQIKAATEQFGVYGIAWGMKFEEDEYIRDGQGNILEYVYKGSFWFIYNDTRGVLPCQSSIKYRAGDDVQMKAETHARSKALSKLGFNSDVYEGKFDDNKYVQAAKARTNGSVPDERTLALRNLTAACKAAKYDAERKKRLLEEWTLHFGVASFDELSVTQLNECIDEIKNANRGVSK